MRNFPLKYIEDTFAGSAGHVFTLGAFTGNWRAQIDRRAEWAIATSVPEPGTLALLGLGLAGMGMTRRRKT